MSTHNMSNEEKLSVLQHNVSMKIDELEFSLVHNIGKENAAWFIVPIREKLQKMEDDLIEKIKYGEV